MEKPVFLKPFRRPLLLEKYTLKMHMANEGEKKPLLFRDCAIENIFPVEQWSTLELKMHRYLSCFLQNDILKRYYYM